MMVHNGLPAIAEKLGLCVKTLRNMKREDPSFPIHLVNGRWRYIDGDYEEWIRKKGAENTP